MAPPCPGSKVNVEKTILGFGGTQFCLFYPATVPAREFHFSWTTSKKFRVKIRSGSPEKPWRTDARNLTIKEVEILYITMPEGVVSLWFRAKAKVEIWFYGCETQYCPINATAVPVCKSHFFHSIFPGSRWHKGQSSEKWPWTVSLSVRLQKG